MCLCLLIECQYFRYANSCNSKKLQILKIHWGGDSSELRERKLNKSSDTILSKILGIKQVTEIGVYLILSFELPFLKIGII